MSAWTEVNFDGIVGPTHHFAGLSYGNLASQAHAGIVSNPRDAALEGLAKMKLLLDLGLTQGLLPPQERPDLPALRALGFEGDDAAVLAKAARESPQLLAACCSASSMWAANAATVSPASDTIDGRLHLTPANLVSTMHRSLEARATAAALRAAFPDESLFAHHDPLPGNRVLSDEGAANHTRLCVAHEDPGVEVFTCGARAFDRAKGPTRFPARQTFEASSAVARRHQLRPEAVLFLRQLPGAIDAGVFHNDVVCVGHRDLLLLHERAYVNQPRAVEELRRAFQRVCAAELSVVEVSEAELPLEEAVATYFFNSQIVTLPEGGMLMLCPTEVQRSDRAGATLQRIIARDKRIAQAKFVEVRQSMNNGGGPACLRLRVVLSPQQLARVKPTLLLNEARYHDLTRWVVRHYRSELRWSDLADPQLLRQTRAALDELTVLLNLGAFYPFQR